MKYDYSLRVARASDLMAGGVLFFISGRVTTSLRVITGRITPSTATATTIAAACHATLHCCCTRAYNNNTITCSK